MDKVDYSCGAWRGREERDNSVYSKIRAFFRGVLTIPLSTGSMSFKLGVVHTAICPQEDEAGEPQI